LKRTLPECGAHTRENSVLPTVSDARFDRPKLWIVAGPNGSGKSTIYTGGDIKDFNGSVWIINPDLLTARIRTVESKSLRAANLEAVIRIYAWLEASIATHQTIGVETVLSTDKYRELVFAAKAKRFQICLIYVLLKSAEMNIERVKMRVADGGHNVPKQKIIERRERSLQQLPWFLEHADRAWIFDNSGRRPRLIATKANGMIVVDSAALPEIKIAAERAKMKHKA
jgi:predicted ABC-type ATPase